MKRIDVFGMCNPLYDLQIEVSDEEFTSTGLTKGGMFLVSHEEQQKIVPSLYNKIVSASPGGSGANTMQGIALLGSTSAYTGHVGQDDHGRLYRAGLEANGVQVHLGSSEGDTGICVVLLTPEGERTMLTYLGRALHLSRKDVNVEALKSSTYLYVTAYLWDTAGQKEAVKHAMEKANEHDVNVVLNLADSFCVTRHKDELLDLVKAHVDVVIGNDSEVAHLTDEETPEEGAKVLSQHCKTVAVTCGERGSVLASKEEFVRVSPARVEPVDTTGAGDMYAAGLLHGLCKGLDLHKAGSLGSYLAAQVVSKLGPRLETVNMDIVDGICKGELRV